MKQHHRLIFNQLRDEFPGIEIEPVRSKTHTKVILRWESKVRHLSISVSPKNTDHAIDNAIKEARRLFKHAHH